jgi:20S proteasome alpha/beta subunit
MTFVLAFKCFNGLVMCADQNEADGMVRRYVHKLHEYRLGDCGVVVGASGDAALIKKFHLAMKECIQTVSSPSVSAIEATIQDSYDSVLQVSTDIQLVASAFCKSEMRREIYKTVNRLLTVQTDYCCTGMDTTLAYFLLHSIFRNPIGVEEATRLGVFITALMKVHADGVAGPTDILSYRNTAECFKQEKSAEDIREIESRFPQAEVYELLFNYWRLKNQDIERPFDYR